MKIKLHIPVEQYGFVELEAESKNAEYMLDLYFSVQKEFNLKKSPNTGTPPQPKDYRKAGTQFGSTENV